MTLSEDKIALLKNHNNIWVSCVRPDGRPHLTPVWFVWHDEAIYIGIAPNSIKASNLRQNPNVTLALEDGTHPLICEGKARFVELPYSAALKAEFLSKYEWDLDQEKEFHTVVEIKPQKWLSW